MAKVLLHVCCAPCATHAIELLKKEHDVSMFFSGSNIYPEDEYRKRLENASRLAKAHGLELIEDSYEHGAWKAFIRGLENEPEKGKRCEKCFEFSLLRTSAYAKENGFDLFSTTLTTSPHKDSGKIFSIGKKLGNFLDIDFKKKEGFLHSIRLSKKLGLYRQEYCGCEFSMKSK